MPFSGVYTDVREIPSFQVELRFELKSLSNLKDITIYRQENPELLKLDIEDKQYKGGSAQGIIDGLFGKKLVFQTCSYFVQRRIHVLLTKDNATKLQLLRDICFPDEDPQNIIDKARNMIRAIKKLLAIDRAVFETLESEYNSEGRTPNFDLNFSQDEIDNMSSNLLDLESNLEKTISDFNHQEKMNERRNTIQDQMENYKEDADGNYIEEELSELEVMLEKYEAFLRDDERLNEIKDELSSLDHLEHVFTKDDLDRIRKEENYLPEEFRISR